MIKFFDISDVDFEYSRHLNDTVKLKSQISRSFFTAFPSIQMSRAKLALTMSWRGNVSNSIYRHFCKCLYKWLCHNRVLTKKMQL